MAQHDSLENFYAVTPPQSHEVDSLLDPKLDTETRQFFDRVKASFNLGDLAIQSFFTERSFILKVAEDPTRPHEFLDELKIKKAKQIIATVFRTQDEDGTKRVIFSKEAALSDKTVTAYFEMIQAERNIAELDQTES